MLLGVAQATHTHTRSQRNLNMKMKKAIECAKGAAKSSHDFGYAHNNSKGFSGWQRGVCRLLFP